MKVNLCRASLVDSALETGAIYEGAGFKYVKEALPNGTLHLIGLLSDGGVHSRFDQLQVRDNHAQCLVHTCSRSSFRGLCITL